MKKNEDRMEASMIALAKQKELDQEKRTKLSRKRGLDGITKDKEEKQQREELAELANKRRKLNPNQVPGFGQHQPLQQQQQQPLNFRPNQQSQ